MIITTNHPKTIIGMIEIKMSYICDDCNGLGVTETDCIEETCDLCGGEGRI